MGCLFTRYRRILRVLNLGESDAAPDAIAVRRTEATGRWIGFHTDRAARTVQVPLADDGSCTGGRLLFAGPDGALVTVPRGAGRILAHDGDAVHGVTRLTAGTRYGLFVLRART